MESTDTRGKAIRPGMWVLVVRKTSRNVGMNDWTLIKLDADNFDRTVAECVIDSKVPSRYRRFMA